MNINFFSHIDFSNADHFKNDCKINSFLGSLETVYVQYRKKNFDHHFLYVIHRNSVGLARYFNDDAVIGRKFTNDSQLFTDQLLPK